MLSRDFFARLQAERGLVERQAVVLPRDTQRLAELSRAGAQRAQLFHPTPAALLL